MPKGSSTGITGTSPSNVDWIPEETQQRIRVWEEAPLLDEIAVTAGYRATLLNLGLVGLDYQGLGEYVSAAGAALAGNLRVQLEALVAYPRDAAR